MQYEYICVCVFVFCVCFFFHFVCVNNNCIYEYNNNKNKIVCKYNKYETGSSTTIANLGHLQTVANDSGNNSGSNINNKTSSHCSNNQQQQPTTASATSSVLLENFTNSLLKIYKKIFFETFNKNAIKFHKWKLNLKEVSYSQSEKNIHKFLNY